MMGKSVIIAICIFFSLVFLFLGWKIILLVSMSLYEIIKFMVGIVIWRFSKPRYAGKFAMYKGRRFRIKGETFQCVKLKGYNGKVFGNDKIGYKLVKKTDILLLDE